MCTCNIRRVVSNFGRYATAMINIVIQTVVWRPVIMVVMLTAKTACYVCLYVISEGFWTVSVHGEVPLMASTRGMVVNQHVTRLAMY